MAGNKPAHMTAKMVMASAERLIEVRHFCRNSNRIAEMSVPAWPMPIQNTKLVISKAHPTLLFRPQTPMPLAISQVTIPPRLSRAASAMPKQIHQPLPGRASMGCAISSVISPSVGWPSTQWVGASTWSSVRFGFMGSIVIVEALIRLFSAPLHWVSDFFEIGDIGPRSEVFEHLITALTALQLRDTAAGIFQIAEHNGLRGARLLAGGLYVAIGERAHALERLVFRQLNPLDAEAALFHDAPGADENIGVQHHAAQRAFHVEIEFRIFGVVVPVEAAHLIRTVVGAVARSDTAVIDLLIEPFGTGGGGKHRTDRLAGRILTVLAHHGLMDADGILFGAAVVAVDTQPVHDANALHLVPTDDGDIVFG